MKYPSPKIIFALLILLGMEGSLFSQSSPEVPGSSTESWITILTPMGESVRLKLLSPIQVNHEFSNPQNVTLSLEDLDSSIKQAAIKKNGTVVSRIFADGSGLLFASQTDQRNAYNKEYYSGISFEFDETGSQLIHYDYHIKPRTTQKLDIVNSWEELPDLSEGREVVFRSSKGQYALLLRPHLTGRYWFADRQKLEYFLADYRSNADFVMEPIAHRFLYHPSVEIKVTRYNLQAGEKLTRDAKLHESPQWGTNWWSTGENVVVRWDDLYLAFDSNENIELVAALFDGKATATDYFSDLQNISKFEISRSSSAEHLEKMLKLPQLDYSFASLSRVSDRINDFLVTPSFHREFDILLTQYVGEVYCTTQGSNCWKILSKGDNWEPAIVPISGGKAIPLYSLVAKTLERQNYQYRSCLECIQLSLDVFE